jgi:transposase
MAEPRDVEQFVLVDVEPAVAGAARAKLPVDKTFRSYDQDQPMLLAPDIRDWLPADHPARWVNDLVEDGLDLSAIYADYTEVRGAPPFDPRLMLKVLIYGYSHGVTSSRALERRCHDDVAFAFLTARAAPDFVAISRFRTRHAKAFAELFTQSLALCARAGLVCLGRVALDGSKVRASASRHRAMSYDRMVRAEGELAAEVEALLADAERLDAAEDAAYGADRRGDELPAELARREGRLAAIRSAKAALEAEHGGKARAAAEATATGRGENPTQVTGAGDVAEAAAVVPATAQRSFTDPDARIMKTSDGSFHYCFNAQTIVDEHSQVVLTSVLRPSGADCPALPGMLAELTASLSAAGISGLPRTLLADAGYFSAENVSAVTGKSTASHHRPPRAAGSRNT